MNSRAILTVSWLLLAPLCLAAPLTLKEAVKFALENSPDLRTAKVSQDIGNLQVGNARSAFLPSLDLTSTHGLQKNHQPSLGEPWASNLNLSLTENLYDNGESIARFEIASINRDIANLTFARTREQLTLDISVQFFEYALAKQIADAKKLQLQILQKQLGQITEQYQKGVQTRRDYLRMATQVKRADIDMRNALISIQKTTYELRRLTGLPATDAVEFSFLEAEQVPIDAPTSAPMLEQIYDYRIAKAQTDLNPLNVRLTSQKYWPQLLLTTSGTYTNSNYLGPNTSTGSFEQYGWNVLLGLNFNFFDSGLRRRNVEIAEANALIQDNTLRKTKLQLSSDVQNLMINLDQLKTNDKLTTELRQAEQETYLFIKNQYENGRVAYLDLITSLDNLLDAKVQFFNARYGLAEAAAKYRFYQGNLYDSVTR